MGGRLSAGLARTIASDRREPDALHRLGALLARWHCWRKHYRTERSYARLGGPTDPEDLLEQLQMASIEEEVSQLPFDQQRAIGQFAQAECLGLDSEDTGSRGHIAALERLKVRLQRVGVL